MKKNKVKELLDKRPVMGIFQGFNCPNVTEFIGYAGTDFVILDSEHGYMSPETMENMVRAADCCEMTTIIRVPQNERQYILRALDIGALGIHVPMVNTREEAEKAVYFAKYYPRGGRGLAFSTRAARYGMGVVKKEFIENSNKEVLVIVHLETKESIENLSEILKVADLDILFIGPTDLAQSLGYYGDSGHEEVQKIIEGAVARIIESGKIAGVFCGDLQSAKKWTDKGVRYIASGASGLLTAALKDFNTGFKRIVD